MSGHTNISFDYAQAVKSVEAALSASDKQTSLQEIVDDADLMQCLMGLMENHHDQEECDALLQHLLLLYQSGKREAEVFVLQFAPAIVWMHLKGNKGSRQQSGIADAILLSIYNKEVTENTDMPFAKSYRMPSLSKPSIYHEPAGLMSPSSALTENALNRHEQAETPIVVHGPKKLLDRIPAYYRCSVVSVVLERYNSDLTFMSEVSHVSFCVMAVRLSRSGYPRRETQFDVSKISSLSPERLSQLASEHRVHFDSQVIERIITGLHFIMYDHLATVSRQAVDDLAVYASFSLSSVAILLTGALQQLTNAALSQTTSILDGFPRSLNPSALPRRTRDPLPVSLGRINTLVRRKEVSSDQPFEIVVPIEITDSAIGPEATITESKTMENNDVGIAVRKNGPSSLVEKTASCVQSPFPTDPPPANSSIVLNHSYPAFETAENRQLRRVLSFERKRTVIRASSETELRTRSMVGNETTITVQLENANPIVIKRRSVCGSANLASSSSPAETRL